MIASNSPGGSRIVILGGGFGGVYTAYHLERLWLGDKRVQVTLVSRDNYFLMTPLLFEAGSGILEPRHAVNPIRPLLRHTRFVEAEVTGVDFTRQMVTAQPAADEQYELGYDHLVLALGGVTNTSFLHGAEHAMTFKTLGDAIFLRNRTIDLLERADVERDEAFKQSMLSFVVIGAGLVGVELIGEVQQFLRHASQAYPHVAPRQIRLELIEAGPRIIPELDEDLAQYAAEVYRRRGINIRVHTKVQEIEPGQVTLEDGQVIAAQTIIAATGVAPSPLIGRLDLPRDRIGRVLVEPTMRVNGRTNVWALGDCASIPSPSGKPYPALAQHALREARTLARNISAAMGGQPLRAFVYSGLGTLAALGHYKGIGRILRLKVRGFAAWWIWRSYYLFQMPRWDRRLRIMVDWTVGLLFRNDIAKLDLFGRPHPTADVVRRERLSQPLRREVADR